MRSCEFAPRRELKPFVRLYWQLELDDALRFGSIERINPDGLLELVFHFRGTPLSCRYDGEAFDTQSAAAAVSQTHRYVEIHPSEPTALFTVRFQPWGAWHFLSHPLRDLADRQVPLDLLWGPDARQLIERLGEAAGDRERVLLVERFLLAQLRRHRKHDIEPLVRAIWSGGGQSSISGICDELGIGERRLQRTFTAALGTSPKHYSRLTRFLCSCGLLRSGPPGRLTDVAQTLGYYDQSHFISDFRAFSGMTPKQFLKQHSVSFLELS